MRDTQQLLHPNISPCALSGTSPHLGSAREGEMHYLGQSNFLLMLQQQELKRQPCQTPGTGQAESHPGSQLAHAGCQAVRGTFIPQPGLQLPPSPLHGEAQIHTTTRDTPDPCLCPPRRPREGRGLSVTRVPTRSPAGRRCSRPACRDTSSRKKAWLCSRLTACTVVKQPVRLQVSH